MTFIRSALRYFFFFQAEDGIRDKLVTGVQTCALRSRVVDFMSNTEEPRDVINSMLQWKPRRAGIHMGRFLLNSTAGIGGFYDVSTRNLGFVAPPETVDETFGVWRIPPGPYFILPVVG